MPIFEFGVNSELAVPDDWPVTEIGEPAHGPLPDPSAAVRSALAEPLEFPPLAQTVVPGDRVVLALEEGLIQPAQLVAAAVGELLAAGIDADSICILRSPVDAILSRTAPTTLLPDDIRDRVRVVVHDPADREQLSLLSISSENEGIYLNRELVEADVVIPIGVARPQEAFDSWGVEGIIYPTFSDDATLQKFQTPKAHLSQASKTKRRERAHEVGWMLGIRLSVQVVAGPGETLTEVWAGDTLAVERRARERSDEVWHCSVPRRASIVVATLPGGRQQQSWANFARVLQVASRLVEENGTIAVCCDLRTKPGPSLRRLAKANSLDDAERAVQHDHSPDAAIAAQVIRTLQRAQVYMLSGLQEDVVQSLGLAYVASPEEVVRLASRHKACILLQNAQQAQPQLHTEPKA